MLIVVVVCVQILVLIIVVCVQIVVLMVVVCIRVFAQILHWQELGIDPDDDYDSSLLHTRL